MDFAETPFSKGFETSAAPCLTKKNRSIAVASTLTNMYQSLSHSRWDCKHHLVFVPKYRKKVIFGDIRKFLGPIFHELARQKECRIVEGQRSSNQGLSSHSYKAF